MAAKPSIAIVGPGRLGSALALELKRAGYPISGVLSHPGMESQRKARALARKIHAPALTGHDLPLTADVVWFCVPDGDIATVARQLAAGSQWRGKIAFHSSGALPSDQLDVVRKQGASVASVHPLMTFVAGSAPSLEGVPFAVEGDDAAVRLARTIVRGLGGETFAIRKRYKAAYHAWGGFTSPLVVAALVAAEQVARAAGLSAAEARRRMLPIVRQTIANYARLGPAGAFSGPLVRGDAEVVRRHLQALKSLPDAREVYLALSKMAVRHLPVRKRAQLARVLKIR